jgi:hypothetical protein
MKYALLLTVCIFLISCNPHPQGKVLCGCVYHKTKSGTFILGYISLDKADSECHLIQSVLPKGDTCIALVQDGEEPTSSH